MHIVKLIPNKNSKYHFGESSLEESSYIFHSNSLFSAIVNNFIKLYGINEFNNYEDGIKKLKISSLFPAVYKIKYDGKNIKKIKDEILFIPKPMVMLGFKEDIQKKIDDKPKDVKKIKFISIDSLKKHNERNLNNITIGKEYLITDDEKKKFGYDNPKNIDLFNKKIEQKVSIDRIKGITLKDNEKGQLYSIEFIKPLRGKKNNEYQNIVGFYFLIDFNNIGEELEKKIKASINLIKDEGLGGKRSIGAGTFKDIIIDEFTNKFNEENLNIPINLNDKYITKNKEYTPKKRKMTLSITVPKDDEEFEKFINYQLIKIGGYIYSASNLLNITEPKKSITILKKNAYAIAEGSICTKEIEGDVLDLKPDNKNINHEIILNGQPILIPVIDYKEIKEGDYE